jgi:hypothetical protein
MSDEPQDRCEAMLWVEREAVRGVIERFDPSLLQDDRAPGWAVIAATAWTQSVWSYDYDVADYLRRVQGNAELKHAICAAAFMGVRGFEIVRMVMEADAGK